MERTDYEEIIAIGHAGLHSPRIDAWLDPLERVPRAIISHAHSDHMGEHDAAVCTPETAKLAAALYPNSSVKYRPQAYRESLEFRGVKMSLLPAGHVLGAAQVLLDYNSDLPVRRVRVLYAGDVHPAGSATTPPAAVERADLLIVEATFGSPEYCFPTEDECTARTAQFVRDARASGSTPVLAVTSNFGKAEDIVVRLAQLGLRAALQPRIAVGAQVYAECGVELPEYQAWQPQSAVEADYLMATQAFLDNETALEGVPQPAVAVVSGWAALGPEQFAERQFAGQPVVETIPWSDHADFEELLQYVRAVGPQEVWTFADEGEFAAELNRRGIPARPLGW